MAGCAVICLEGVLCKGFPPNGAPIPDGLKLYASLAHQYKVVLDSHHGDITEVEHWCRINGLERHALAMPRDAGEDGLEAPVLAGVHLAAWKAQGFDIALYVTADPAVATITLTAGVITLLLVHPSYARPEFRPDHERGMKPWADIEAEVTAAAERADTRVRVDAEMQP